MKIIYKTDDNGVAIITPTQEALELYTIEQIAQKDVPVGKPYKIVEDDYVPSDRTFRECWEINEAELTDGIGSELNTFKELV